MGFFEGLGSFLGEMAGQMEEWNKQIELYRPEYEGLSNRALVEQYKRLKDRSDTESKARWRTVNKILRERGVIK